MKPPALLSAALYLLCVRSSAYALKNGELICIAEHFSSEGLFFGADYSYRLNDPLVGSFLDSRRSDCSFSESP